MRASGTVQAPSGERGSHLCWLYDEESVFQDVAVRFLGEGAGEGDRLVYVADRPSSAAMRDDLAGLGDVDRLVDDGRLVLTRVADLYDGGRGFDGDRQVSLYRELTAAALHDGYRGLRVAADATALVATEADRRRFVQYELAVDRLMAEMQMTALCAYDQTVVGARGEELCVVHPLRRVGRQADPAFCLYHDRGCLRLSGEIDLANHDLLTVALDAAAAGGGQELSFDLSAVSFIDVGGLTRLARFAADLDAAGRALRLVGAPSFVRRCCRLLDFDVLERALCEEEPA